LLAVILKVEGPLSRCRRSARLCPVEQNDDERRYRPEQEAAEKSPQAAAILCLGETSIDQRQRAPANEKFRRFGRHGENRELLLPNLCRLVFYPAKAQLVFTRAKLMDNQPVSFPNWKQALALAKLSPTVKASHAREIIPCLHHCSVTHTPASGALI
jgi:hypothetical protein